MVDRTIINNLAVRVEPRGVITNPARLLTGPSGDPSVPQPIRTYATAQSFNGTAPAHDEEIYHCPTAYDGCGVEFKTLSGLLQHMESECCDVRKFRNQVTKTLDILTAQMGRIAL
ncbi:hypothetical protein EIP86_011429 [Pleurotus ostreatoroseus]|nr:hypothetical protein EIP86_011429 [Pleurotus ostreatoroseus]